MAFVAAFGAGCGGKLAADSFTSTDGGGAETLPAGCNPSDTLPSRLECTGLYSDLAQKAVWPSARSYVPSSPLWSDGAGTARWLRLPPGTTIDRTNPNEWVFPVGTKVWKEFSRNGHRIETRLFAKLGAGYWTRGTDAWNADETAALPSGGGDVPLPSPAGQAATADIIIFQRTTSATSAITAGSITCSASRRRRSASLARKGSPSPCSRARTCSARSPRPPPSPSVTTALASRRRPSPGST